MASHSENVNSNINKKKMKIWVNAKGKNNNPHNSAGCHSSDACSLLFLYIIRYKNCLFKNPTRRFLFWLKRFSLQTVGSDQVSRWPHGELFAFCRRILAAGIKHLTNAVNFQKHRSNPPSLPSSLGLIYLFYDTFAYNGFFCRLFRKHG